MHYVNTRQNLRNSMLTATRLTKASSNRRLQLRPGTALHGSRGTTTKEREMGIKFGEAAVGVLIHKSDERQGTLKIEGRQFHLEWRTRLKSSAGEQEGRVGMFMFQLWCRKRSSVAPAL